MSRYRLRRGAIGLSVAVLAACSQVDPKADRFSVTDSAGIAVATSLAPRIGNAITVESRPRLIIPNSFGEPKRFLYRARHAVQLGDGTLVVGNQGSKELFFFAPDGRFLDAVGGDGDGPGEFQNLFDLYRCSNDHVLVEETSRLSMIDGSSRRFMRTVPIVGHLADLRNDVAGVRSDCSAVLMVDDHYKPPEPGVGLYTMAVTLYWAELETGARDTLSTFPAIDVFPWMTRGHLVGVRPPYGRVAQWAPHADGVVVAMAEAPAYQIVAPGGGVKRIVRWNSDASALADADWAYFERETASLLREYPGDIPPADHFPRPATKPAYSIVLVDAADRVWVQHYGRYGVGPEPSPMWSVFSAEGEWLAEVRVPDGLEVLSITESLVIGAVVDELDVETIQLHPFDLTALDSSF